MRRLRHRLSRKVYWIVRGDAEYCMQMAKCTRERAQASRGLSLHKHKLNSEIESIRRVARSHHRRELIRRRATGKTPLRFHTSANFPLHANLICNKLKWQTSTKIAKPNQYAHKMKCNRTRSDIMTRQAH